MSPAELWVIAATVIFFALIWKPAKKALGSGLDTRRTQIVHNLDEASRLRTEAEAILADAKQRQDSATKNAADLVAFAKAEVARMRVRAEADTRQSIARRERQANDRIAQAEASALAEIRSRAVDLALDASVQLLTEKLSGEAGNQIVDDVIATLARQAGKRALRLLDIAPPFDVAGLGRNARAVSFQLAQSSSDQRNEALIHAAAVLRDRRLDIGLANESDLSSARGKGLSGPLLDRLALGPQGLEAMAAGLEATASLPDPLGRILAEWDRPNGLNIQRVSVPIGVIGIIYESRPNVTADAGGLCIKSGNATILRSGSESFRTSSIIAACLREGLESAGLPTDCVQFVGTTDRRAVGDMLRLSDFIDVIVPRGGKSLVARVAEESRIPVFAHLEGLCHVYLDSAATIEMARDVTVNAKLRRVSVCGAAETLLIDRLSIARFLPVLSELQAQGCEIRGDDAVQAAFPAALPATEADWRTEYLDRIIAVATVDGVAGAIRHINTYGSHHTDSIVTEDMSAAEAFLDGVDSGIVLVNASTQFADGGEFGFGAEIGISTGKLHARGPIGAEQLTTYKYKVRGSGQTRP